MSHLHSFFILFQNSVYFVLIEHLSSDFLHFNSHIWLAATILGGADLEEKAEFML